MPDIYYYSKEFNSFAAHSVNFRGLLCTDAPSDSVFSGPVTHLLLMLCVLMKILSHASAKTKTKRLKGFKFRTFNCRFEVTS